MKAIIGPLAAAALLCVGIGAAAAQNAPAADGTPAPQQPGATAPQGSLSHELNRSNGVIQPPPTGDRGVVKPPNRGASRTPVIPPPGTPGGNPRIEPK